MTKPKRLPKDIVEKADRLLEELDKIEKDPELPKRVEEFYRKISKLTPEDLLTRFGDS